MGMERGAKGGGSTLELSSCGDCQTKPFLEAGVRHFRFQISNHQSPIANCQPPTCGQREFAKRSHLEAGLRCGWIGATPWVRGGCGNFPPPVGSGGEGRFCKTKPISLTGEWGLTNEDDEGSELPRRHGTGEGAATKRSQLGCERRSGRDHAERRARRSARDSTLECRATFLRNEANMNLNGNGSDRAHGTDENLQAN